MKMTIGTIAKLAGVSASTVSKIIHGYDDVSAKTKEAVLRIMEEAGYGPPSAFGTKAAAERKTNLIGVIHAGKINAEFNHLFFVDVLNAFKKQIGLFGYDLLFFSNEKHIRSGEDYAARCRQFQVDGCIIVAGDDLEPSIAALDESDIPCVGIDLELTGQRSGCITTDHAKMAHKVVEHFYLQGYRDIGFIGSSSPVSLLREQSFRQAVGNFGLSAPDAWIVREADFFEQSGYRAMSGLNAAGTLPRAIFAASDQLAIGAMRALKEAGLRVPQHVALIGCDDIESCKYMDPPLSTIRQNKDKIGTLAAHMLFDLMNRELTPGLVMVEPELVVRET